MDPDRPAPDTTLAAELAARLEALRRLLGAWRPDPNAPYRVYFDPAGFLCAESGPGGALYSGLYADRLACEDRLAAVLADLIEPIEAGAWHHRLGPDGELQSLRIDAAGLEPEFAFRPK